MPLQNSGTISIANIVSEFGGTSPHSLSEYYRGVGLVPNTSQNLSIPTSGTIQLSNFYGAANRVAINISISSNTLNYLLNTAKASGYVAGSTDVTLTINTGVYVSSYSTGLYALDIDTSWAAGDTINIVNNGFIVGMGGAGGIGGGISSNVAVAGSSGSPGGPALRAQRQVSINNSGTIASGGGGGGGGQSRNGFLNNDSSGGGGGGGRSSTQNSSGGAGGVAITGGGSPSPGTAGNPGTTVSAGSGGAGGVSGISSSAGSGGTGGDWGSSGTSGLNGTAGTASAGPYSGGSSGSAIVGNSNISWIATGIRLGAIT